MMYLRKGIGIERGKVVDIFCVREKWMWESVVDDGVI